MDVAIFQVCMTALLNLGFAWMVGALAASHWLVDARPDGLRTLAPALSTAMLAGIGVAFVAMSLSLWQAAATMADVSLIEAGPALLLSFASTQYGRTGLVALSFITALGVLHGARNNSRRSAAYSVTAAALLLLFAAARVRIGHAYEFGPMSLAAVAELVHLLSMAVWVGSVFVAAWVVLSRFDQGGSDRLNEGYLRSLSQWATVALAGVLVSGLYNAYRVLNTPTELLGTRYGWVLTVKLCFVTLAVALGGWNRMVGFPAALADRSIDNGRARFVSVLAVLRVESVALLIVLIAAAVLTGSAPPSTT